MFGFRVVLIVKRLSGTLILSGVSVRVIAHFFPLPLVAFLAGFLAAFFGAVFLAAFLATLFGAAFLVAVFLTALVAFFGAALFAIIGKDRLG